MSVQFEGKTYTNEEAVKHLWDTEKIMDLMNRRVYYGILGDRRAELEHLWVKEDAHRKDASLGSNYGWYQGFDEVCRFYVDEWEAERKKILDGIHRLHPEIEIIPENLMVGYSAMAPDSTPLLEIAEDQNSAQGMWYSIAQETVTDENATASATWYGQKIAADFVREGDDWKILHLVISVDYFNPAGTNHSDQPLAFNPEEDPLRKAFGHPTIEKLTHDSSLHWSDNYPPQPVPYKTYDSKQSYGPDGWRIAISRPAEAIGKERMERAEKLREKARKRPMGPPEVNDNQQKNGGGDAR